MTDRKHTGPFAPHELSPWRNGTVATANAYSVCRFLETIDTLRAENERLREALADLTENPGWLHTRMHCGKAGGLCSACEAREKARAALSQGQE